MPGFQPRCCNSKLKGAGAPTVNQAADNKTTDAAQDKNWDVFVRYDRVREANKQSEKKAHKPTRPVWQLNAPDNKADGKPASESP